MAVGGELASGRRLNQSQRGQTSIKLWRKLGHSAFVGVTGSRGIGIFEITPTLVRAARARRDGRQLARADDVDAPVLAILEAKDLLAGDQAMPHDPVERAADDLGCALGPHPRRDSQLAADCPRGDPLLEHFEVAAGKRDLGQMERRHDPDLAANRLPFKRLADQQKRRQSKEAEEAHDVGHGRHEHRR